MDYRDDRKWKCMSSISERSIHCYQKFLSSIEYWKVSGETCEICLETCRIFYQSSSIVSIQSIYFNRCLISETFYRERTTRPAWSFAPLESHRLTEQDITDFVNCIKEYVFISIFNKDYAEEAAQTCRYLSILRPELIVPVIVEKYVNLVLIHQ